MHAFSKIHFSVGILWSIKAIAWNHMTALGHQQHTENAQHGYQMRDTCTRESYLATGSGAAYHSCKEDKPQTRMFTTDLSRIYVTWKEQRRNL